MKGSNGKRRRLHESGVQVIGKKNLSGKQNQSSSHAAIAVFVRKGIFFLAGGCGTFVYVSNVWSDAAFRLFSEWADDGGIIGFSFANGCCDDGFTWRGKGSRKPDRRAFGGYVCFAVGTI